MKKLFYFLCLVLFSCLLLVHQEKNYAKIEDHDYEKIADQITIKTAVKLKEEKNLIICCIGGQMMHDIQKMSLVLNYNQISSIENSRQLLIYSVEEYLEAINESEKIKPFLHHYPFTSANVDIIIYFHNQDGHKVPQGQICIAVSCQGEIRYYINDRGNFFNKIIHREQYEDALKASNFNQTKSK